MSELDDFLAATLPRQLEAERAIHNGDPEPRMAMWSTNDPVTVLGAVQNATGWDEASKLFRWLAAGFSNCTAYSFDLVAAGVSGDLVYTTGYEHTSVSWDGVPLVSRTPCASRMSTGARTASGRSSIAMATKYPPTRMWPLSHRSCRHGRLVSRCGV